MSNEEIRNIVKEALDKQIDSITDSIWRKLDESNKFYVFNNCDRCGGPMRSVGANNMICSKCGRTWNNI